MLALYPMAALRGAGFHMLANASKLCNLTPRAIPH